MEDIIKKVEVMVNCKTCRWSQFCVKPPTMTRNEVKKNLKAMERDVREDPDLKDDGFSMLMGTLMLIGKDTTCSICPGFARRMEGPVLSQKIKELMQGYQEGLPQCKKCGWDKFCLEPPTMTEEEVKARTEKLREQDNPDKALMGSLMGTMLYGGRATECSACYTFIEKFRESPNLVQQIKKIMQSWED